VTAPRSAEPDPATIIGLVMAVIVGLPLFLYMIGGFLIVQPRTQVVVLRWGKHIRTITDEGIAYVFPIGRSIFRVTSSVLSIDLPKMMVLEYDGSPIEVSGVCSFRVAEAHKAVLGYADFNHHVAYLATAVLKNVCSQYPYESPDPNKPCLRKETEVISRHLVQELQELVAPAGIQVLQMRINDLTYAPEIAQSMLLRQQANAMVDARRTIVEGAVDTVTSAIARMQQLGLAPDNATVESLASNLMLVLCSGERIQTVMPVNIDIGGAAAPGEVRS
jgi:regulator of protease activity HflC (stomatin/prohibitin superfamily)